MVDEAKTADPVVVDPKATKTDPAVKPEAKAEDSSAKTIASLQRELQRVRNRAQSDEQRDLKLTTLETSVTALVNALSGQESVDEAGKATLNQVRQLGQTQTEVLKRRADIGEEIKTIAEGMGIKSWDDPRLTDVVDAFNEGDLTEALSLVKQARRTDRAKSQEAVVAAPTEAEVEARVAAAVERKLKELGVRQVDTAKPGGTPGAPATLDSLLAKNISAMTPAEMAAHKKELLAESRKG